MMEENRKGPGVFYAVVGVATLVVAIIGATFAYFSASTDTNTDVIGGQTASAANITLEVEQVSPTDLKGTTGKVIPLESGEANTGDGAEQYSNNMETALKAGCIYNGYVACQVYKVTVTNAGADPVTATPKVQLTYDVEDETGRTFTNLRWQKLNGTSAETFGVYGDVVNNHTDYTKLEDITGLTNGTEVTEATKSVQYFVVWLEETGLAQDETGLGFEGKVTVDVVDANNNPLAEKLTASFGA